MSISGAKTTHNTPGAASALYVAAAAWVLGGLLLMATLWENGDGLDGVGAGGNAPALIALVLCLFGATVSFGTGAVLQRMAAWQAAEVENG